MDQKQINITDPNITITELYKLALQEQKNVTALFAQLNQAQANVTAIEAEIAKRETATPNE